MGAHLTKVVLNTLQQALVFSSSIISANSLRRAICHNLSTKADVVEDFGSVTVQDLIRGTVKLTDDRVFGCPVKQQRTCLIKLSLTLGVVDDAIRSVKALRAVKEFEVRSFWELWRIGKVRCV